MALISIPQLQKTLEVQAGAELMQALLDADLPVASSCDGDGVCAKCRIQILTGSENLSLVNEIEQFLCETNPVKPDQRISCQVVVLGDITIATTYW